MVNINIILIFLINYLSAQFTLATGDTAKTELKLDSILRTKQQDRMVRGGGGDGGGWEGNGLNPVTVNAIFTFSQRFKILGNNRDSHSNNGLLDLKK